MVKENRNLSAFLIITAVILGLVVIGMGTSAVITGVFHSWTLVILGIDLVLVSFLNLYKKKNR